MGQTGLRKRGSAGQTRLACMYVKMSTLETSWVAISRYKQENEVSLDAGAFSEVLYSTTTKTAVPRLDIYAAVPRDTAYNGDRRAL